MPVLNEELYDKLTPEYLVRHPNLAWVTVNESSTFTLFNSLVKFKTGNVPFDMAIGRKFLTNYSQIGKVRKGRTRRISQINLTLS